MASRVAALVLAAGSGSRFGGGKLLAPLGGKPLLQHVLDRVAAAGVEETVVVLGADAEAIEQAMDWRTERRVRNPDPDRGLASSLQAGMAALDDGVDAVLILLGDQPLVSTSTIRSLLDVPADTRHPIVVPRYETDAGRNPVLVRRGGMALVRETEGDRGLGPLLEAHPELVHEVPIAGSNPDVDTTADLARATEAAWGERVRANREQVDRVREVPDGADFYAPVRSLFRADPRRTDDPVLNELLELIRPGEAWLDVGAGAGRFALPLARALDDSGGSVIAVDASPSMLEGLREIAEDHGIENIRTKELRWPPADPDVYASDVALIAHVGYDTEAIGPFLDALEAAAGRLCVAVMMTEVPASAADPFWPPVHGEPRSALPAMPAFLELLRARGRRPSTTAVTVEPRRFESREALAGFVRRQLWIDPAGPKEARFQAALDELTIGDADGWAIRDRPNSEVGILTWNPRP
jgi:molybdenum cofactor cytidylyltransferase